MSVCSVFVPGASFFLLLRRLCERQRVCMKSRGPMRSRAAATMKKLKTLMSRSGVYSNDPPRSVPWRNPKLCPQLSQHTLLHGKKRSIADF
jgi:hypothetical protein